MSMATEIASAFPWCSACKSYHHPDNPTCRKLPSPLRECGNIEQDDPQPVWVPRCLEWMKEHPAEVAEEVAKQRRENSK